MAAQNTQSKLVTQLRNDNVQLRNHTTDNGIGQEHDKKKYYLETRLDVPAQDIINRIKEDSGLNHIKLISGKKNIDPMKRLDEQNVMTNSKMKVFRASEPEAIQAMAEVEKKKKSQDESMQRTQKGFQILSERDGLEDPMTTPFLEIADQKGNPLTIPPSEKKALILAMGLHEKGRALMKRRQHEAALSYLIQADTEFRKCDPKVLNTVDNYAVLQLDVVWCYQALDALDCLKDSKERLQCAEDCFRKCYGEQQERLLQIKGSSGGEEVLFLRLYLLQTLLAYYESNNELAKKILKKVEDLYERLRLDTDKLKNLENLMAMGFSDQEARLGLRACQGDESKAEEHIRQRRKDKEQDKEERRRRQEGINTLVELGFAKRDAAHELQQANGDVDKAYVKLLDSHGQPMDMASSSSTRPVETQATQLLSPSPPSTSSPSEEPSTSSESTGTASLDADLVNEVLEDIPEHEEDYLDLTLDEERVVIDKIKSYLEGKETSC
ncbi:NEDD8 ultimate buster 1-like isoform X2 [Sardina pilchardus]|uniref:NEDD8 ultimate buster 1-like isoform X2 n=1 Tax=Sardina pilchardus TaxID=27697 RepID=UPI002E0DF136